MPFRRQVSTMLMCASLIGMLGGCAPASNSPFDEQKEPHVIQGQKREATYDYPGAIESYHRALEVNPRSSIAHYRLGLLYESEDRDPAAAIYHFQQYLKLRPNSENGSVIRQRILGCKQQLAKEVSLGLVSGEMKNQLDELIRKNQSLAEENQRLTADNRRLEEQLGQLQLGLAAGSAASPRPSAPSTPFERAESPSPAPRGTTHTVQRGDTYYSIAKRHGISTSALEAANPGVNPNRLSIGQRLTIPRR